MPHKVNFTSEKNYGHSKMLFWSLHYHSNKLTVSASGV